MSLAAAVGYDYGVTEPKVTMGGAQCYYYNAMMAKYGYNGKILSFLK